MMKSPEQLKGALRNLAKQKESMHKNSFRFLCLNVSLSVFLFLRTKTNLF